MNECRVNDWVHMHVFLHATIPKPPSMIYGHGCEGSDAAVQVCLYIRPEADFTSLEALVARIHQDAAVTREALQHPALAAHRGDPSLQPGSHRAPCTAPDATARTEAATARTDDAATRADDATNGNL